MGQPWAHGWETAWARALVLCPLARQFLLMGLASTPPLGSRGGRDPTFSFLWVGLFLGKAIWGQARSGLVSTPECVAGSSWLSLGPDLCTNWPSVVVRGRWFGGGGSAAETTGVRR